ncbi:hypothetical protein O181_026734 [Austropuccinia psidii MF-1]|uniref:Integrase catalytic domain-containing protein n=1 Tax=Austropuccinia psidii MF-1 TaxID=1389203 RepID=A0A9Q3CKI6_9BASI|nr:hypothetical protein [Austropuccinia psidii MF-1]
MSAKKAIGQDATPSTINWWTKLSFEAITTITSHINCRVFLEVINSETSAKENLLWSKIDKQYASKRAMKKGCVWMNGQKANYTGNLHQYIEDTQKFLLELESVSIKMPSEILSYIILGKLAGDPKLSQVVELLTLNEDIIEKHNRILSRLQEYANHCQIKDDCPSHNPKCLTHKKEECFAENPHLRPQRRDNKRKAPNASPASHISTAQALHTSVFSKPEHHQLVVDCGAAHHMFHSKDVFTSLAKNTKLPVTMGDSSSNLMAKGIGTVNLLSNNQHLTFPNSLFVPKLNCNLISLLKLFDEELIINQHKDSFPLTTEGKVLLHGKIENNLMKVDYHLPTTHRAMLNDYPWHKRLGDIGKSVIKSMGLPSTATTCKVCALNKAHRLPFKDHFELAHLPLDGVHIDLVGPFFSPSISGCKYILTIVDQATSFKIVCFLKNNSNAFHQFTVTKKLMETQHNCSLKKLVSDQGGEFLNSHFQQLANECGFMHSFSPAYTPKHNGFAERANRTILEKMRCMLNTTKLPNSYWAETVSTATLLSNSAPTPLQHNHSPHTLWTGLPPRIKNLPWEALDELHPEPQPLPAYDLTPDTQELVDEPQVFITQDKSAMVDETRLAGDPSPNCPNREPNCLPIHIKVIGPRHPNLVSSAINPDNILSYPRQAGALLTTLDNTPNTYNKAISSPSKEVWLEAINRELLSMEKLNVWDVVEVDPTYKLGFTQTPGVDFDKTYSPTGRLNSLRVLIAFSESNGLLFHQIDVKSAFLNAPLVESVYLGIPQGLRSNRQKYCLRLKKAMYGLRQAPLAWYKCLKGWLCSTGFKSCTLDPCVFYCSIGSPLWLYVHVDNIALFGKEVEPFKRQIAAEFEIKDIGLADLMLGVKITQRDEGITLNQQHFSESLLELYGMGSSKPTSTPLISNCHLGPTTADEVDKFKALGINYCSAIGSINYLSTAPGPTFPSPSAPFLSS